MAYQLCLFRMRLRTLSRRSEFAAEPYGKGKVFVHPKMGQCFQGVMQGKNWSFHKCHYVHVMSLVNQTLYYTKSCIFRCTLEGKRERKGYKELLDDPQLRYSGVYERSVERK